MKIRVRDALVHVIKKYRLAFAWMTLAFYAIAIVLVVVVFPDVSNLWVSVFVLISGLTASITSVGELLVSADESAEGDEV